MNCTRLKNEKKLKNKNEVAKMIGGTKLRYFSMEAPKIASDFHQGKCTSRAEKMKIDINTARQLLKVVD